MADLSTGEDPAQESGSTGDGAKAEDAATASAPASTADAKADDAKADEAKVDEAKVEPDAKADDAKAEPDAKSEPDAKADEPDAKADEPDAATEPAAVAAEATDEGPSEEALRAAAETYAPKPAKKPKVKRTRPPALVLGLAGALVVLVAVAVTLFVHNHKISSAAADRAAALDVAQQVATNLTTITADNSAGQIDALSKMATGSFKDQINGYSQMFQTVVKQANVASKGVITAAGVENLDGNHASALVTVTAMITSGQVPGGAPMSYRLLVSLEHNGGAWLVSNVEFLQ